MPNPASSGEVPALRRAELAKIHVAARDLGLDDEVYRQILCRLTGHRSAAELDQRQRRLVLDELKRLGFQQRTPAAAGTLRPATGRQARMIRSLWAQLRQMGALRDPSEKALGAFCEKLTGIAAIQWLPPVEANKCIEVLKQWVARVEQLKKGGDGEVPVEKS